MFRMTYKIPISALMTYYISFIGPILEYGNVMCDNCTRKEAYSIEVVQK